MVAGTRVPTLAVTAVFAGTIWLSAGQTPAHLKEFEASMTEIGDAFEIIEEMTPSPVYLLNSARGDAIARVDVARPRMDAVRKFFADRKKRDGVEFSDAAIAAIDAFRIELTRTTPDQAAAIEALEEMTRACAACHAVYREGDTINGYRFKAGAL